MKKLNFAAIVAAAVVASPGWTHSTDAGTDHITATANYGFNVIGRDSLIGNITGRYTDVWSHKGYAYVGTFQQPTCDRSGVFVVDIAKAVENYASGQNGPDDAPFTGAMVAEIKSAPNTRVNDVKVHTINFKNKTRDILVATEEKCGATTGSGKKQLGQGGISIYDVTNPSRPSAIKQHAISNNGIHNTYLWTGDDGKSYAIAVDDVDANDVIIVDMSKPQAPTEVGRIGIGDWLDETAPSYPEIADDGQLQTGVFAAPLLHDVWVTKIDGRFQAVLSYWDAGFVVVDVHDPANPEVLGDSTYPETDPVYGVKPGEGNAHAAVFGGDEGQYLWAGDEDFDPFRTQAISASTNGFLASQGSDVPQVTPDSALSGDAVYVGRACDALPAGSGIAVIERGDCAFTTKAGNAEIAGYDAVVIFNQSARDDGNSCEGTVSMLVEANIPALFVPRSAGFDLIGLGDVYDADACNNVAPDQGDGLLAGYEGTSGGIATLEATFDGWGYYHVLNNLPGGTTTLAPPSVPGEMPGDREVLNIGYLGHMGYFVPQEAVDPMKAVGFGDLSIHNMEGDPLTAGETPTFNYGPRSFISWYSLGMRAVEYRPGHWHTGNGGVWSWNVHEVGQFIAEDGSNFWGVHVDQLEDGTQIILGSDRNTGLWIFTFTCETQVLNSEGGDTGLYCRKEPYLNGSDS